MCFCETLQETYKYMQPGTGKTDQVPRHPVINENLARQIIKNLS
jgi:hypothetical protein